MHVDVYDTPIRGWLKVTRLYADRRVLAILFLGFSSGLPLALIFGTLCIWLAEVGADREYTVTIERWF